MTSRHNLNARGPFVHISYMMYVGQGRIALISVEYCPRINKSDDRILYSIKKKKKENSHIIYN